MADTHAHSARPAQRSASDSYEEGEEVEALYRGEWLPGKVVSIGENIINVTYDGYEDDGTYPVGLSSVRSKRGKAPSRDWETAELPFIPKRWATELEIRPEPGLPGTFFASIPGPPIMDRMTNLGIYAVPTVGFYPYQTQFEIQPKCIIEAPGNNIRLPKEIHDEFVKRRINEFQFFFVVNDVSQVIHNQKMKKPINLINHTWIHPMIEMGNKLGYGKKWWFGCYSYEDSGVGPVPNKIDLSIQMLSKYELHIHPQKGGMCLSPNNCKFMVNRECPVSSFWTVAVEDIDTRRPRCSVTLHWLVNEKWPELDDIFGNSQSLSNLLCFFQSMVEQGRADPPLIALLYNFGILDTWQFRPDPQAKKAPQQKNNNQGKNKGNNKKGKIECELCGRMLGGNLKEHQQSKRCRQAAYSRQLECRQAQGSLGKS